MITLRHYGKKIEKLNLESINSQINAASKVIAERSGEGHEFMGWMDYCSKLTNDDIQDIIDSANLVRSKFDTLVCVGIGGSYLGGRAVIDAINGLYSDDKLKIVYLGNTLSPSYTHQILKWLEGRNFAVNVISKSGTTTEPAVAFRLLKELIIKKWGTGQLKDRIFATTDKAKGALKSEANVEGYKTFVIPDDIGGRFSVITPVGLFPIACAGIDIRSFVKGLVDGEKDYGDNDWHKNLAYKYGAYRYLLNHEAGYPYEMFCTYDPQTEMICEWLKQLFGESLGKDDKGLMLGHGVFTTDLHSMGQFIQQGSNVLFETVIHFNTVPEDQDVEISADKENLDNLNYLAGQKMSYINEKAFEAVLKAHTEGQVDANVIDVNTLDAYNLGNLFYFFFRATALTGYLDKINPFNQPGVEIYKKNMFVLLGKPGYTDKK